MKIGLMRHFKVLTPKSRALLNSNDFTEWIDQYNTSEIVCLTGSTSIEPNWDYCFSSNMSRAFNTAQHVFEKEILTRNQLKEIDMAPLFKTQIKLPLGIWLVLGRLGLIILAKNRG